MSETNAPVSSDPEVTESRAWTRLSCGHAFPGLHEGPAAFCKRCVDWVEVMRATRVVRKV